MTVGKRNAALCALISLLIVTLMSVSLTQAGQIFKRVDFRQRIFRQSGIYRLRTG